jgi:hypothetical protein
MRQDRFRTAATHIYRGDLELQSQWCIFPREQVDVGISSLRMLASEQFKSRRRG